MTWFMDAFKGQLVFSSLVACVIYVIFRAIHNLYFHPLAKFPGPKLRGAFFFPQYVEMWTGTLVYNWHELHEKYGDVVRLAPDRLSFIKPEAWKDIYGYGNKQPTLKCPEFYYERAGEPADIISAGQEDHTRIRHLLNHAFSEQALRSQEDIINSYITLMITKLKWRAATDSPVDMMRYLNFTTFDITGDLAFDESFGSLESENYNDWIANIFGFLWYNGLIQIMRAYGVPVMKLIDMVPALAKQRDAHDDYTKEKAARRLDKKTDRKDFISYILRYNDERGMTHDEIKATSATIVIAGSETSATLLGGAIYYLLKNPEWNSKLQQEVRATFTDESQITFASTSQLKILNAIIYETFRVYPPVPIALPRVTPKEGAVVLGTYIPPDITIGIPHYAAYRSSRNFKNSEKYAPERFLGDKEYAEDKRSVIQPFSVGPRNCIGQNLAWAEMRMILVRLTWHFDFEMLDESKDWEKQKVYTLWTKPSLMVKLKDRYPVTPAA